MGRFELGALALGAVAAALVLYATSPHGPALFQLGMHNAVAAECLLRGETMLTTRGEVFAQWPPLLPLLLAAGRELGAPYELTARAVNAASLAAIVFFAAVWLRKLVGVAWVALAAGLALALQTTLFEMSTVMSSEPLFLALALAALFVAHAHAERPTPARLAAVAVLSALACLQRYVGVVLVGSIAVLGWLHWPRVNRWKSLGLYLVAAGLPLAVWMARNVARTGALTGERPPADFEADAHVANAWRVLTTWWVGEGEARWAMQLSAGLFLGLSALSAAFLLRDSKRRAAATWLFAPPLLYAAFLIVVASTIWLDPLDVRLLSPLLVFGCMLAPVGALALLESAQRISRPLRGATALVLALAALAAVGYGTRRTLQFVEKDRSVGPGGFGNASTRTSELIAWLREHELDGTPYSNAPEYYAYATWRPAKLAPAKRTGEFLASLSDGELPLTLIWAAPNGQAALRSVRAREALVVETLAELADGVVCRVSRR